MNAEEIKGMKIEPGMVVVYTPKNPMPGAALGTAYKALKAEIGKAMRTTPDNLPVGIVLLSPGDKLTLLSPSNENPFVVHNSKLPDHKFTKFQQIVYDQVMAGANPHTFAHWPTGSGKTYLYNAIKEDMAIIQKIIDEQFEVEVESLKPEERDIEGDIDFIKFCSECSDSGSGGVAGCEYLVKSKCGPKEIPADCPKRICNGGPENGICISTFAVIGD